MAKLRISGDSSGYVDLEVGSTGSNLTSSATTNTFNGNVGIGTSSPQNYGKLAVAGTIAAGTDQTDQVSLLGGGGTARIEGTGGNASVNLALSTKGAGAVYFWRGGYGGTLSMLIDASGYVTMPSQPGFHVANSNTGPATSNFSSGESSLLHFDYVVSNVGSGWNTSSKRYTAPVTGRYMIYAQVRFDGLTTYSRCWVSTNGGTGQWWNLGLHNISSASVSGSMWSHTITGVIPLAAGDYIELRGGSNNSVGSHQGEGSFGGFLVG